jgi:hypothetical protein
MIEENRNFNSIDTSIYYDVNTVLSHNCLLNYIVGERGVGKSFGFKKYTIDKYLKNGKQWIYLRRYDTEFKEIPTYFDDIKIYYPNDEFEVKSDTFYINGEIAGYAIPLSKSMIKKSNPYPLVDTIIFDEFLIDNKTHYRYLHDEVLRLLSFMETVFRLRNNVRLIALSNAISWTNPHFVFWRLDKPNNKNGIYKKDDVLLQIIHNEKYRQAKKATRLGKLVMRSGYGEFMIENDFLKDSNDFILKSPKESGRYLFTLIQGKNTFGVYLMNNQGFMYVSSKYDPSYKITYTTMFDDHKPNTMLLKGGGKPTLFTLLINYFKNGCVYFDNLTTKNLVMESIRRAIN